MFESVIEFFTTLSWSAVGTIILIDILLGGDNAVVIALACRNLPEKRRMQGILWGTAGAIILRVLLIMFAMTLLNIPFLKIVGALLLLWIGIKLLIPDHDSHENIQGGATLASAIRTIIIADFVMSLDNVIAIAGAAQTADPAHQTGLVIFGLLVSVPIIIWGSTLVLKLIDRFPVVVTFGAGLLGWIAGGMLVTDVWLVANVIEANNLTPQAGTIKLVAEIIGAALVIIVGLMIARSKKASQPAA